MGESAGVKAVHFTCADGLSGLASCPLDVLVTADLTEPIQGKAVDRAGNEASTSLHAVAPSFTTGPPPDAAQVNERYSFTFTATGVPMPTFSIEDGALPAGLVLASTGELTGTPTTAGAYSFSVAAVSGTGRAVTGPLSVTVTDPGPVPLAISSLSLPGAYVGRPYEAQVQALGGVQPYVWNVRGKLPAGLTFDSSTGTFTGVPSKLGTYSLTVALADATGASATQPLTIEVVAPDIQLAPAKLGTGRVGKPYTATFTVSGGQAPYTFATEGDPVPGLALSEQGTLSGTPTEKGTYLITVRATDIDGAAGWRQYSLSVR